MNSAHFLFCFSFHSNYLQIETQIVGISRTSNTVAKAYNQSESGYVHHYEGGKIF